jgi:hypothetical protein
MFYKPDIDPKQLDASKSNFVQQTKYNLLTLGAIITGIWGIITHYNKTDASSSDTTAEARGKNWLPDKGDPDSTKYNGPRTQGRKYGPDGYPVQDWNKGHPGAKGDESNDHVHDYQQRPENVTPGKGERQPGRAPTDEENESWGNASSEGAGEETSNGE